jgi:hypothetical protein
MRRSILVPFIVIPSKKSVHQNAKKKTERRIHGQHDDTKCGTMMCRKVMVADPMRQRPNQSASRDKTEKLEQSPTGSPVILGNMENHKVVATIPNAES